MAAKNKKLGEILVSKNAITPKQLSLALNTQNNENEKLGKILIGQEAINKQNLYKGIAEKFGLEFVDLQKESPDLSLIEKQERESYFALEVLPFKRKRSKIIIAATDINEAVTTWAAQKYRGTEVEFVITSPFDILWSLQNIFEQEDTENAQLGLSKRLPQFSALGIFSKSYYGFFALIISCLAMAFYFEAKKTYEIIFYFCNAIFFAAISFKIFVFANSFEKNISYPEQPESKLPIYTILVPLYREEKTLPNLIAAIKNLDYPKSKLDVKLVVEADDELTISALKMLAPPAYMEIIHVPFSIPRTKPKACNYALRFTRGEYVTIYDAEDIPEPKQLKKVIAKFAAADNKLACVQARLNYFNHNESQIARWFSLEYGIWFNLVMRGFAKLKLPIPLGGTSNHVRARTLREIGGWDSFNVTEDADLGMRLAQFGYRVEVVDSVTMEEAVFKTRPWLKQRARWLKGFMQTYFVHMQQPAKLINKTGVMGFFAFQFFVGLPVLTYLIVPALFAGGHYWGLTTQQYNIGIYNFAYGALAHIIFAAIAAHKLFGKTKVLSVITFPLYTLLPVIAAYQALWQLITKPYHWNKTEHGVSKIKL